MKKYFINDFKNINKIHKSNLDIKVLQIIQLLSKKVGAVNYNKTPVFAKKWKVKFKKTILKKNEVTIDKIVTLLNKLTKTNYSMIEKEIIENIIEIIKNDENKHKIEELCIIIFNIASKNKFWCDIYAKLCNSLIGKFPIMKNICEKNFNNLLNLFQEIRFADPTKDYELFCKINDENEKRKAMCYFFVCLMKYEIISESKIIYIINKLIDNLKKNINNKNFKNENFEICECLCVLIKKTTELIKHEDDVNNIKNFIELIINLNIKEHDGMTSKTYFKFLDVFE